MLTRRILFIVEGQVDEVRILGDNCKGLLSIAGIDAEVIPIGNPIYELYDFLKDDEYEDIVSYLHNKKKIEIERSKTAFSSIYLIFDFEHHYQKYSDDKIKDLLHFFNNETENGKLYINYPMVEAFYHLKAIPDEEYIARKIPISLIKDSGKTYKKLVNEETCFKHKASLTKEQYKAIVEHNYRKACKIINLALNDNELAYDKILQYELNCVNKESSIDVLSTIALFITDNYSYIYILIEKETNYSINSIL